MALNVTARRSGASSSVPSGTLAERYVGPIDRDDALASFAMAYAVRTQKDYDQLAKSKRNAARKR